MDIATVFVILFIFIVVFIAIQKHRRSRPVGCIMGFPIRRGRSGIRLLLKPWKGR